MVLSVNLKSKLRILNINFAQQVSIVSTISQIILDLSKGLVPLASINHWEANQVKLLVHNAQKAIIVLKGQKHLLLALRDHIVLKEQVITSNSSA